MPDYDDWVTLATMDDHTPMWSGPRDLADDFLASDLGRQMVRALVHQNIELVTLPFGEV